MRSNGVVHIGNDTFLAVTRDVTDHVFLFSSSFPPQEQIAPLQLNRRTRFHPHASLACNEPDLRRHTESATRIGLRTEGDGHGETEKDCAASTPPFRHTTHASHDGKKIAFISNVRTHHYIMDISSVPAVVCEVEMPEVVQSVCWHTVAHHVLCVLFISGDLIMYDTDHSHLGVIVPRHRRIAMRALVERCLADTGVHVRRSCTSPSATQTTPASTNKTSASNSKEAQRTFTKSPLVDSPTRAAPHSTPTAKHTSRSMIVRTGYIPNSPCHAVGKHMSADEVAPFPETGKANVGGMVWSSPNQKIDPLPTSQLNLVDMCALPPTESTPVVLLLLSSSGDVYTVQLRDDCLPVLASEVATDDGGACKRGEGAFWGSKASEASLSVEVYHLISGADTAAAGDEALAIGGCLLDADAGTHAVFFCTVNGLIRGAWVSEPDLLTRHRVLHTHAVDAPNISFTLHLSGQLDIQSTLSPDLPSATHTVGITLSQNVCVVRSGYSGKTAFVVSFPRWDRRRQGWVWWPPVSLASLEEAALPLLSTDAAPPLPIVLRLPYDTTDASIAVGCTELVLVPEVFKLNGSCKRSHTLSISLAALLRSALYARCDKMQLCPSAEANTRSHLSDPALTLHDLLNILPRCHRCWLRGVPRAEMSAVTVDLVEGVQVLTDYLKRREVAHTEWRGKLMVRLAALQGRVEEMSSKLAHWQQIVLDGIAHRRGGSAFHAANDRLGKVFAMLNELEQHL